MKLSAILLFGLSLAYGAIAQTSQVVVKTPSMEPTIHADDLLEIAEGYYFANPVHRFDIVSLKHPAQGFKTVARIIALGGEIISITNNRVFINSRSLEEPFKIRPCEEPNEGPACANFGPFKVPDGEFFLLADNRNAGLDSRLLIPHTINQSNILGKVVKIIGKQKTTNSGARQDPRTSVQSDINAVIASSKRSKSTEIDQNKDQSLDIQKVTLFARHNPKDKNYGKAYFSFKNGVRSNPMTQITNKNWDIKYGYASINGSSDNFGVTLIGNDRSRIKDLGMLNWVEMKEVPVLLANPGPYRGISFPLNGESIDVSSEGQIATVVDGHMYVAHIKNDTTDLYVLLRVDGLVPSNRCTISWKIVKSPEDKR